MKRLLLISAMLAASCVREVELSPDRDAATPDAARLPDAIDGAGGLDPDAAPIPVPDAQVLPDAPLPDAS